MEYDPNLLVPIRTGPSRKGPSIPGGGCSAEKKGGSLEKTGTETTRGTGGASWVFPVRPLEEVALRKIQRLFLFGDRGKGKDALWIPTRFRAVVQQLEKWWSGSVSENVRQWIMDSYMHRVACPTCGGGRLRPQSAAVRIADRSLVDVCAMSLRESKQFFDSLPLNENRTPDRAGKCSGKSAEDFSS
jgi:hypothetical protein